MAHTRYPWGTETPGPRLRSTSTRARQGLEQVKEPGFADIVQRGSVAVQASRPLVDTVEYLARAGMRVRGGDASLVAGETVTDAAQAVRVAVAALAGSSLVTVHERIGAYVTATEALIELAEQATEKGIAGSGEANPDDPWQSFPSGG